MTLPAIAPRYRFGRLDKIIIDETDYGWDKSNGTGHFFRRVETGFAEHFTHDEIHALMLEDKLSVRRNFYSIASAEVRAEHGEKLINDLENDEQRKVLWKQTYCDRFLQMEVRGGVSRSDASMMAAIALIATEVATVEVARQAGSGRCGTKVTQLMPPKPCRLRIWLRRYQGAAMNPMALRDHYGKSGNRTLRIDPDSIAFANAYAVKYASSSRPSKAMLFDEYEGEFKKENTARDLRGDDLLQPMSRRTFEKLIGKLDPFHAHAAREGIEAARRKFGIEWGGLNVVRPFERIEMDEWRVSLQALLIAAGVWAELTPDRKAAVERTRAWLSAAECCATRCIPALRLVDAPPSSASAIATLEMIVSDKSAVSKAVGLETPWDQYGSMETVGMDSGSSYVAIMTQAVIHDLGAEPFYPPSGLAQMRGRIERLFGTFGQRFVRYFSGQTFENFIRKGEYDSVANATVNLEELNRTLVVFVVDAYHNTPHEGLAGETPRNAWLRLSEKFGVLPPPDAATRRHIFGIACERRIRNKGIRFLGIHYQSRELQQLRRVVGQKPVLIRVDRFNFGEISVRTDAGWMRVRPAIPELNLEGVSYWEWTAAVRDLRRKNADISKLSVDIVHSALARVRDTAEMAIARAELGSPILGTEDVEKLERTLFPDFGFGADRDAEPADILEESGDMIDVEEVATELPVEQPAVERPRMVANDSFGGDDDWLIGD